MNNSNIDSGSQSHDSNLMIKNSSVTYNYVHHDPLVRNRGVNKIKLVVGPSKGCIGSKVK